MRITLEAENEEEEKLLGWKEHAYPNVKEFFVHGIQLNEFAPKEFYQWSGRFSYLIGQTYYLLKKLEAGENDDKTKSSGAKADPH